MPATREDAVRLVRDSLATSDVEGNPATFDPPEWAIRAVQRAYERGDRDGYQRCANLPAVGGPSYASTSRPTAGGSE